MVDVGGMPKQRRTARATGKIRMTPETIRQIEQNNNKKGDVLTVAEIAGVQATKKTAEWIPLCHTLPLTGITVEAATDAEGVVIESSVSCVGPTGVEMEALTAVSAALLTVYDMCKAIDKNMVISDIILLEKTKE